MAERRHNTRATLKHTVGRLGLEAGLFRREFRDLLADTPAVESDGFQALLIEAQRHHSVSEHRRALITIIPALKFLSANPVIRGSSPTEREAARAIAGILHLWDKGVAWLGTGRRGKIRDFDLARDRRTALLVAGETEEAEAMLSDLAYCELRRGNYMSARNAINVGLHAAKTNQSRRALLSAKVALALRLRYFHEVVDLFTAIAQIDEQIAIETPGVVLAQATAAIVKARTSPKRGVDKQLAAGLDLIGRLRVMGHAGFELQACLLMADLLVETQDYGALLAVVGIAQSTLNRFPDQFSSARRRLLIAGRLGAAAQVGNNGQPRELAESCGLMDDANQHISDRVKCRELRGALRSIQRSAVDGDVNSSVAMLCVAVELVTTLLIARHGLNPNEEQQTLSSKNHALREAGVYDDGTFERIRELMEIRNKVLHANLMSVRSRQLASVFEVLDALSWLCSLISRLHLEDYEAPASAEHMSYKKFLDSE